MRQKSMLMRGIGFGVLVLALFVPVTIAETLYVDGVNGNDGNPGTEEKPLLTIGKAAIMVNRKREAGPTTIKVAPAVYNLSKAVVFENNRPYTEEERLIIESTVLPDDPNWIPALMPVILSSESSVYDGREKHTFSLKIEVSHVTIRGLKLLGNPAPRAWHYAFFREGKSLEDLVVTQCLFVGDRFSIPYNLGVCANGQRIVLDHNIFYNCEIPVVFWNADGGVSKGCAMRHCIVDSAGICGVWTCQTGEDFEFHHNIITRCECFWMRAPDNRKRYRIRDCIITHNKYYSGYGTATELSGQTGLEVTFEEKNVIKTGDVVLEKSEPGPAELSIDMTRNYLHVVRNTLGSELGAGLFVNPSAKEPEQEEGFSKRTYPYKKVDDHEILADVYLPKKTEVRPVVIYIHAWCMANSRHHLIERWRPLLDKLIEANYAVVSIDFRLAPETKLEQMIEDVRDACVWVREKGPGLFNVEPNKITVIGGSSGGYFAFTAGYTVKPAPQVVVAVSGPVDLGWAGRTDGDKSILRKKEKPYDIVGDKVITVGTHADRYKLWSYLSEKGLYVWELLGFEPELEPDRFNALLPINNFASDYPPTLLIYSEGETYADAKEHLDAKQIENVRLIVPEGHSSQIIRGYPEAVERIVLFLNEHLKQTKFENQELVKKERKQ